MDRASIEKLYRTYGPIVLRRARALLGEEQAAKDAMQEVFIRALKSGDGFRGDASPTTWLYRVTTNYCLNLRRDDARRKQLLAEQGPPQSFASGTVAEDRADLRVLLGHLSEEAAEVAVYYYLDEMNQEEIAEMLGVSRRQVRTRIDEAKVEAKRLFMQEAGNERSAR